MEVTSKSQKLWKGYLRDRFAVISILLVIFIALPNQGPYFELGILITTLAPTLICAEILSLRNKYPISETYLAMGMPLGIMASSLGLVVFSATPELADTGEQPNVALIGAITSLLLLGVMWGIIVSVIGYFLRKGEATHGEYLPIDTKIFFQLLSAFLIFPIFAIFQSGPSWQELITIFFLTKPIFLCIGLIGLLTALRKGIENVARNLSDASLATMVLGITISLVPLYAGFGADAEFQYMDYRVFFSEASYGYLSIFYGSIFHVIAFFVTLRTGQINRTQFSQRNFHMLEAYSFFVFMTLAAPSIFELV